MLEQVLKDNGRTILLALEVVLYEVEDELP
jgi:hypothetical protein